MFFLFLLGGEYKIVDGRLGCAALELSSMCSNLRVSGVSFSLKCRYLNMVIKLDRDMKLCI